MTEPYEDFNANTFIDELVEEMGMQNEDPVGLAELKKDMLEALTRQLWQAAEENIDMEAIDIVLDDMKDEEDPGMILRTLIHASPGAQLGMLDALEEFRINTLEAFNKLKV